MYVRTQRKQLTMEEEKYLSELASFKPFSVSSSSSVEEKIAKHKTWLNNLSREYPNENHPYKVAIYIHRATNPNVLLTFVFFVGSEYK